MEGKRRREGDKERRCKEPMEEESWWMVFVLGFAAAPSCDKLSNLISRIEQVRKVWGLFSLVLTVPKSC